MLCLLLKFGAPRPRGTAMVLVGGTAALLVIATAVPFGPFVHFDEQWLLVLQQRLVYLFPSRWGASTFAGVAAPLAVLIVGSCAATDHRLRNLCLITTVTVLYGLLVGVVGGDLLHIALASELQTWRWLWLSMVLAIALSPVIAVNCWGAGPLLRAAAVLLVAAWLTSTDTFSLLPAGLACVCALLHWQSIRWHRRAVPGVTIPYPLLIEIGAWAVAAVGIVILAGQIETSFSQLQALQPFHFLYDTRVRQAQILCLSGVVPALMLVLAACALEKQTSQVCVLIGCLGIIVCLALLPYGIRTWTHIRYPAERYAAFESWRQAVAPATEVLWPNSPEAEWFLLGRASYWSLYQMAGMVFSRDVTMIATRREAAVTPLLPLVQTDKAGAAEQAAGGSLAEMCKVPGLKFFASWNDLGPTPYPPVAPNTGPHERVLRLYRCSGTVG
jgi:hypothetical protein